MGAGEAVRTVHFVSVDETGEGDEGEDVEGRGGTSGELVQETRNRATRRISFFMARILLLPQQEVTTDRCRSGLVRYDSQPNVGLFPVENG